MSVMAWLILVLFGVSVKVPQPNCTIVRWVGVWEGGGRGGARQTKGQNKIPKIYLCSYIYKFIYIYEVCIHKRKNTKNLRTSSHFAFLSFPKYVLP